MDLTAIKARSSVGTEIATDQLMMLGWLPFHAAAFADKGRGVLIVGPRRAGKTSLLLHALAAPSSHPISNDRAVISPSRDGQLRLEGLATVVRIRVGTADLLGRQDLAKARDWRARHSLAEVECCQPFGMAMVPSVPRQAPWQYRHYCITLPARVTRKVQKPLPVITQPKSSI